MRMVREKMDRRELIKLYERLLDKGRIKMGGSAHRRLIYLREKKGEGFNILDWKSHVSK